jgi:uncharacterized protein YeaO (DUF488 family)
MMRLSQYSYGSPRRRGEGLRIGCTRYLARGVRKGTYAKRDIMDVWLPMLAPSKELLAWIKSRDVEDEKTWNAFLRRYRAEMKATVPRQTIMMLAQLAQVTPIAVGCYCGRMHCHRFELEKLIRAAADDRQ